MRFTQTLIAATALVMVAGVDGAQTGDAKGAAVMAEARKALGGEQKLAAVKALSIRGSYTRVPGPPMGGGGGAMTMVMTGPGPAGGGAPQSGGEIAIDIELPDKYISVDTGTGMAAMTRTEGFEGERPFSDVASNQPGLRVMSMRADDSPTARHSALRRSREDLARLLLGIMAAPQSSFNVTYSYAGQAESPDGKADVVDIKGSDNFAARLFLDPQSHLPLMLTYIAPEPRMVVRTATGNRGGRGGESPADPRGRSEAPSRGRGDVPPEERAGVEQAVREAAALPAKMVEYRLFFSDYRESNGLRLPHQISRGTAEKTTEEWVIKGYTVNPTFKADRFAVGK